MGVELRQQEPGLFLDTLDGVLGGASDSVLDALADALRLDEAERAICSTSPARANQAPAVDAARPLKPSVPASSGCSTR
jgi:hypothetical protein